MSIENELNELIKQTINNSDMPYVSQFRKTDSGFKRIYERVKQHIFVRGVTDVETALSFVEDELSQPTID